jgi:carbon monoxide dehydrogenase subunit G
MKMAMFGNTEVDIPVGAALKFSINLGEIVMCIPTSHDFKQIDDKNSEIKITMDIAHIKGTFTIKTTLVEQTSNRLVYGMEGHGIGSTLKETLTIDLHKKSETATEVSWGADVELEGLVSGISESVLRKISENMINETIANIKAKLENQRQGAVQ